jgi:hypothetical protein
MKKVILAALVGIFALAIVAINACDTGNGGGNEQCNLNPKVKQAVCLNCCGVDQEYDAAITNRLQTGFLNYNKGYLAWLEWCDELYDENAYYNVYGHRFTLDQYKRLMGAMFEQFEISLGGTEDTVGEIGTIITDSLKGKTAINYDVSFRRKTEEAWVSISTMEFVQFRKDDQFGAKVIEGWALSSAQIEPDPAVIGFWMNPANGWDVLLARVATW